MRFNLLFVLSLSFIGDVFSQRGPMMLFRGIPGPPMVPGRFPVNGFALRSGPFIPGFGGAPGMQPGFMGLPGTQTGFQGPMMQRGPAVPGFPMVPSGSMAGTSFPGSGQINGMTNLVIPSPQFNGAASPFGSPGGTVTDVRWARNPFQLRHRNQPDSGVVLDRAVVAQQWQRQRLTHGIGGQDTPIRQAPTIQAPQFPQGDSFPMIPAPNSGSNGASSSVSTSQMLAPAPSFPPRGFSGTMIIPQQQSGLSAQPSGIPLTPPPGFGPSSNIFGQQDQFQGIIADTNGQFQQGMPGFSSQSQTPIMEPSISETFITRFQPLPGNVENFRQQLQTGRAGTGVDNAIHMVPSDRPVFSVQFQNNEPVRAFPAEPNQAANRVIQGFNASTNAPMGQVFSHVPSNSVFQSGLHSSVPSQGSGLTDPNSLREKQFQSATNVATVSVASPLDASNRISDMSQAAPTQNFINLLSNPSDFSFFADQSRKDSKTNTNLVDSQTIDPNQRVIFSMDSKGRTVRLQPVDVTSQNTVEGLGPSQVAASTPAGGNNTQSFSFMVSGNINRVKVEPPAPPSVGLTRPSLTGITPHKPEAPALGGHDNHPATPNAT